MITQDKEFVDCILDPDPDGVTGAKLTAAPFDLTLYKCHSAWNSHTSPLFPPSEPAGGLRRSTLNLVTHSLSFGVSRVSVSPPPTGQNYEILLQAHEQICLRLSLWSLDLTSIVAHAPYCDWFGAAMPTVRNDNQCSRSTECWL